MGAPGRNDCDYCGAKTGHYVGCPARPNLAVQRVDPVVRVRAFLDAYRAQAGFEAGEMAQPDVIGRANSFDPLVANPLLVSDLDAVLADRPVLSEQDAAIVRQSLLGVTSDNAERVRGIHAASLASLTASLESTTRAVLMRRLALELLDAREVRS